MKSLLVLLALVAGMATAEAQTPGQTMTLTVGCTRTHCTYNIFTWTYNPSTGQYFWKLTETRTLPGKDPATIEQ